MLLPTMLNQGADVRHERLTVASETRASGSGPVTSGRSRTGARSRSAVGALLLTRTKRNRTSAELSSLPTGAEHLVGEAAVSDGCSDDQTLSTVKPLIICVMMVLGCFGD